MAPKAQSIFNLWSSISHRCANSTPLVSAGLRAHRPTTQSAGWVSRSAVKAGCASVSCIAAELRRPNVTAIRFESLGAQTDVALRVVVETVGCLAGRVVRMVTVDAVSTVSSAGSLTVTSETRTGAALAPITQYGIINSVCTLTNTVILVRLPYAYLQI